MKLAISVMTAVSFCLTCMALADHYKDLAAQGYRWVTVDGPFACTAEQDVQRIVAHHTDATELQAVQTIQCYYLIPGTVVQVINECTNSATHIAGDIRCFSFEKVQRMGVAVLL